MTKIFRRSNLITFILALAVLLCSTALAFADTSIEDGFSLSLGLGYNAYSYLVDNSVPNGFSFYGSQPGTWSPWKSDYVGLSVPLNFGTIGKVYKLSIDWTVTVPSGYNQFYLASRGTSGTSSPSGNYVFNSTFSAIQPTDLTTHLVSQEGNVLKFHTESNGTLEKFGTGVTEYHAIRTFGVAFMTSGVTDEPITVTADNLYLDDMPIFISVSDLPLRLYTYNFTVPTNKMLSLLATDISDIKVNYSNRELLGANTMSVGSFRYNYKVDNLDSKQDFYTSNLINFTKASGIYNNKYVSTIEPYSANSRINFYNYPIASFDGSNTPTTGSYNVSITCSSCKAYYYEMGSLTVLNLVEDSSSSGAIFIQGGNGTADNPYQSNVYNNDGQLYAPVLQSQGASGSDSAVDTIVNALSAPSRFISIVKSGTGEFMQTISTLYSWLPVELTSVIVGAFSVIIAVGVLKMFL